MGGIGRIEAVAAPSLDARVLERLFAIIEERRGADPAHSYTARLFSEGRAKMARKIGEEVVIAALAGGREHLAAESADLLYHLLVLWADAGVAPDDVWRELGRREGVSGLAEKASRGGT
jgi:phosphoribosyl-ATP pyrophosphohydrolase